MPRVVAVSSPQEFAAHINEKPSFGGNKGVVVDFTAAWCGPCKMFGPIFDAMSDQYPSVTFLKVDVDELQEVAQKCQIRSMPTCQAYVNANKIDEFSGADRRALTAMLDKVASQVSSAGGAGLGRKLGGDNAASPGGAGTSAAAGSADAPVDEAAVRRARMAAAAEARMNSAAAP